MTTKLSYHYYELPEKTMTCPLHGDYSFDPVFFDGRVHYFDCPICLELKEKWKTAEEENPKYEKRLKKMNIGLIYRDSGFNNFNAYSPELKTHLKTTENFTLSPVRKLVMLGNNGAGKTHLAVSVLKQTGGVIYTAFEIGVMLRRSYNGDSKEWEVLNNLCEINLLIIDEIGRSKGSDWELNWLSHVINKRHENLLPLILISNRHLGLDCPERGCKNCLENYFDNDVISRIIEDGVIMKFTGDDYRHKNRLANLREAI